MTPKNAAFAEEFPWLEGHLNGFGESLHNYPCNVKVQRVDERLLLEAGNCEPPGSGYGPRQEFLFLDEQGAHVATTRRPRWKRWLLISESSSVSRVLQSLTPHALARVRYVLQIKGQSEVVIHKAPREYTLAEWLQRLLEKESQNLKCSLEQIDTV